MAGVGFCLQCFSIERLTEDAHAAKLRRFLAERQIAINENFDFSVLETDALFDVDQVEGYLAHWEVGWDWWEAAQILAIDTLGDGASPHMQNIFAWFGVAVPGEFSVETGDPAPPSPTPVPKPKRSFLERLWLKKPAPKNDSSIDQMIQASVQRFSGGAAGLQIVSSLALERELAALLTALGHLETDPKELYETAAETEQSTGLAMAAVAHRFIRLANQNRYLVWFIK